jgi:hypothetical protein
MDFYKYWWDEGLSALKYEAIRSFKIWADVGKPRGGVAFTNMKRDK